MSASIWDRANLTAWEVVPWDERRRTPDERARMLAALGIPGMAYDWRADHVPEFGDEIQALARHGVRLDAWWFPTVADDPMARPIVELLASHGVAPELWVTSGPTDPTGFAPPPPYDFPTEEAFAAMTPAEREAEHRAIWRHHVVPRLAHDFEIGDRDRAATIRRETGRIRAIRELAAVCGSTVQLYGHNGWFGMTDNQIAVIDALAADGITDVGIVYNFHHSRDEFHDDSRDFPALWSRMSPYVTTVNLNGTAAEGEPLLHTSQGDSELGMMRVIQESGWRGRVGVTGEIGGDMAITLADALTGLDWCAAELASPGSAGARPTLSTGGSRA